MTAIWTVSRPAPRSLRLSADGKRLDASDLFAGPHGESLSARARRRLRGALPSCTLPQGDRHSRPRRMLVLPNKEVGLRRLRGAGWI